MRWHHCSIALKSALGAMSGPLLAGKMLALGTGTVGVMAASAPGIVLAGVAVFWLMNRHQRRESAAR